MVEVLRGKQNAEAALENFEASQSSEDRLEGWRYFIEKTTLKAGIDPAEATHQRQVELDLRESKAIHDAKTPIPPSEDAEGEIP